jgi:hypothetical protein
MNIKKMRFPLVADGDGSSIQVNIEQHETSTNSRDFPHLTRQCVSKQNTNENVFYWRKH